jgi:hypothetical protein
MLRWSLILVFGIFGSEIYLISTQNEKALAMCCRYLFAGLERGEPPPRRPWSDRRSPVVSRESVSSTQRGKSLRLTAEEDKI